MSEHLHRCKTHLTEAARAKLERFDMVRQNQGQRGLASATTLLSLKLKYVVIPLSESDVVPLSQIQAQHAVVNTHYLSYEKETTVQNTAHYPYFVSNAIMGDPYLTFAPSDPSAVTAEVMAVPTPLPAHNGFLDVAEAEAEYKKQGGTVTAGTLYVYITKIVDPDVSGTILGMARDIIANALMIDPGTVGSPTALGTLGAQYGAGKTLLHELGHCFGLLHPFSDAGVCNDAVTQRANPQSPAQKNPNYYTTLAPLNSTGNCLDNRGRDQLRFCTGNADCQATTTNGLNPTGSDANVPAYSCASRTELRSDTLPYETFMSFMDYGDDSVALGFPTSVVSRMRTVIQSHPDLFDVSQATPSTTVVPSPTDDGSGFPTWAIIVLSVVGGLIALAILVGVMVSRAKTKTGNTSKSATKPLQAYQQPFLSKHFV